MKMVLEEKFHDEGSKLKPEVKEREHIHWRDLLSGILDLQFLLQNFFSDT
jgi:hypothetical protein